MNKKDMKSDNRWKADNWLFHGRTLHNLQSSSVFMILSSDTFDVDKEQETFFRK